jgi:hypothetical protein
LRALIVGIEFEEIIDVDCDDAVDKIMKDFDTTRNDVIDKDEFFGGIERWLSKLKRKLPSSGDPGAHTEKFLNDFHQVT